LEGVSQFYKAGTQEVAEGEDEDGEDGDVDAEEFEDGGVVLDHDYREMEQPIDRHPEQDEGQQHHPEGYPEGQQEESHRPEDDEG